LSDSESKKLYHAVSLSGGKDNRKKIKMESTSINGERARSKLQTLSIKFVLSFKILPYYNHCELRFYAIHSDSYRTLTTLTNLNGII